MSKSKSQTIPCRLFAVEYGEYSGTSVQDVYARFKRMGYDPAECHFRIEVGGCDGDDLQVWGQRLETEQEVQDRLYREKLFEHAREESDRTEFERLCKKFEVSKVEITPTLSGSKRTARKVKAKKA